ncbi:hypothetical protein Ddye_004935 [Dipteronia dyeriana]|uniref:HAT C-terminal dimerisation domain-containing protein n=1 Tax=Dipteronia dyeriana TaxID=168575 RepID=A0AAD9XFK7_9ROSI|nr:hypothetical protein Ddye_004935 [Dipteronia dyeriana]
MSEPDPVQPDNIGFEDTAYHEFLQRQAYLKSLNYPANLNPPSIISEPNASQPSSSLGNMTSQLENIPDFAADPNFEEALEKDKKQVKFDLFIIHMKKFMKPDGTCWAAITALKNTSGLNLEDTAHIGSILRLIIQQNLPRGVHNLKFLGDGDVDQFDILHCWREHQKHFSILSIMAKQILTTSVSTVAVEQEFSTGEIILDARRSLLSPESIQVHVCVDDWTNAEYR